MNNNNRRKMYIPIFPQLYGEFSWESLSINILKREIKFFYSLKQKYTSGFHKLSVKNVNLLVIFDYPLPLNKYKNHIKFKDISICNFFLNGYFQVYFDKSLIFGLKFLMRAGELKRKDLKMTIFRKTAPLRIF